MEKVSNNMKFYTFISILSTYSDEESSLSIKDINVFMKKKLGVTLDRRTVYSYIKDMRLLGISVSEYNKQKEGYYLKSYAFKEKEVLTLIDAIKTSNFISKKKTEDLIDKILKYNAICRREIRQVDTYVDHMGKTTNDDIIDNAEKLRSAIRDNTKIEFCYMNERKQMSSYKVNPICLMLDNNTYYLLSVDDNEEEIKCFNIDKMKEVKNIEEKSIDLGNTSIYNGDFDPKYYLEEISG